MRHTIQATKPSRPIADSICLIAFAFGISYLGWALKHSPEHRTGQTAIVRPPVVRSLTPRPSIMQIAAASPASALADEIRNAPRGPNNTPMVRAERLFQSHPELRDSFLTASLGKYQIAYGQFFVSANLTDYQRKQFCEIFVKREEEWAQIQMDAQEENLTQEAQDARWKQAGLSQDAALRAVLSSEQYDHFSSYRKSVDFRTRPLGVKALMVGSMYTEPFSQSEINDITDLVMSSNIESADSAGQLAPNHFRSLEGAAMTILSPQQLEMFNLFLDDRQIATQMGQAVRTR